MILWAFLLSIAFIPGVTGAAIPTGWAFLSVTLPFMLWRGAQIAPPVAFFGLIFLVFAFASLAWTPIQPYGVWVLWQTLLIAGAFILGSTLDSLDDTLTGLALGCGASSLLCIPQFFGWNAIPTFGGPAGLFYNTSIAGVTFAVIAIWLIARQRWVLLPLMIPGLALNTSRSWLVVLGITGLLALARRDRLWLIAFAPILAAAAAYLLWPENRDFARVTIYHFFLFNLKPFGWGVGAQEAVLIFFNGLPWRPEYAHSLWLDLAFQYGVLALIPAALLLFHLLRPSRPEWYPYAALLTAATFSFVLSAPVLAAIAAVLAGHLGRDWYLVWSHSLYRRSVFYTRPDTPGCQALPLQSNPTNVV